MMPIESNYPESFRADDTAVFFEHIRHKDSVVLVGMKRVGISNFLRFLHYHIPTPNTIVIVVDLHDLIEKTPSAFWMLLLKRLVDSVESLPHPNGLGKLARKLFIEAIQLKDGFFTLDCAQKVLKLLVAEQYYPIIFLSRFDRLQRQMTSEFFGNLQSLRDSAGELSYVFTSYRPLEDLVPDVFSTPTMRVFAHTQYVAPLTSPDSCLILQSLADRYQYTPQAKEIDALIDLAGGHVQYLHLAFLCLMHTQTIDAIGQDEAIALQSEELLSSLTDEERLLLQRGSPKTDSYLSAAGFLRPDGNLFSPLFAEYVGRRSQKSHQQAELSKQEQALFHLLCANAGQIVERDTIIENVWPDQVDLGVSDWAIDRLIARLRAKLKVRHDPYRIVTVVSRGYKLIAVSPHN